MNKNKELASQVLFYKESLTALCQELGRPMPVYDKMESTLQSWEEMIIDDFLQSKKELKNSTLLHYPHPFDCS